MTTKDPFRKQIIVRENIKQIIIIVHFKNINSTKIGISRSLRTSEKLELIQFAHL